MNKNFLIFLTGIFLRFKQIREYSINLYLGILSNLTFMTILIFSYSILKVKFSEIFYWSWTEYIFFMFLLEIFLFLFAVWFTSFRSVLLSGELNTYLTKPVNTILYYVIRHMKIWQFTVGICYLVLFIIYLMFFIPEINISRFLISIIFSIFGGILLLFISSFNEFISFFFKDNRFVKDPFFTMSMTYSYYPFSFFNGNFIKLLGFLMPLSFYAVISTDYYFGYINFLELLNYFYILLGLIVFFSLSSYFLWKIGIKKYEAYG